VNNNDQKPEFREPVHVLPYIFFSSNFAIHIVKSKLGIVWLVFLSIFYVGLSLLRPWSKRQVKIPETGEDTVKLYGNLGVRRQAMIPVDESDDKRR